jgi:hypothetical protein
VDAEGDAARAIECETKLDTLLDSAVARAFLRSAAQEFDWTTWKPWPEYLAGTRSIVTASVEDALRVCSAMLRQERFVEGTIAGLVQSGTLTQLADRLRQGAVGN